MQALGIKSYNVYAETIQNNHNTHVGTYEAYNKEEAIFKARKAPENKGIYFLDSYYAICRTWWFQQN